MNGNLITEEQAQRARKAMKKITELVKEKGLIQKIEFGYKVTEQIYRNPGFIKCGKKRVSMVQLTKQGFVIIAYDVEFTSDEGGDIEINDPTNMTQEQINETQYRDTAVKYDIDEEWIKMRMEDMAA